MSLLDYYKPFPGENLLTENQASIETDTTGWIVHAWTNATISRITSHSLDGEASLQLESVGAGTQVYAVTYDTLPELGRIPLVAGRDYIGLASFRRVSATPARSVRVDINWADSSGTYISTTNGDSVPATADGWVQAVVTRAAPLPVGAVYASLVIEVIGADGAGEQHAVDCMSFSQGSSTIWTPGGRSYLEADFRKQFLHLIAPGPLRGEDNKLAVYGDSSGRQVKVRTGKLWSRGHYGELTAEKTLAIAANSSGNPRVDRVVARVDFVDHLIELDVLQGTPASGSPAPPALTQDATGATAWEESLAQVAVANGAAVINPGDVTDERAWGVSGHGAGGILASVSVTGDVSVPTTGAGDFDFSGYSITFVAKPNRRYRVSFIAAMFGTNGGGGNPNGGCRLRIREGSTQLASSQLSVMEGMTSTPLGAPLIMQVIKDDFSAGLHTVKLSLYVGTGVSLSSVSIAGSSSAKNYVTTPNFVVEDCGPA